MDAKSVIKTNVTKYYEHKFSFRLCDDDNWTEINMKSFNEELTVDEIIKYLSKLFMYITTFYIGESNPSDYLMFVDTDHYKFLCENYR